jgi:hypothetical protein
MGGIANYTDAEAAEAIKQGRVRSIGSNEYVVETNGGTLFNNDGEPFIFSYTLDAAAANNALAVSRSLNFNARRDNRGAR